MSYKKKWLRIRMTFVLLIIWQILYVTIYIVLMAKCINEIELCAKGILGAIIYAIFVMYPMSSYKQKIQLVKRYLKNKDYSENKLQEAMIMAQIEP